ncbi:hypothetical protein GII33_05415 [Gordonia pseudamarae]|jgi:hypothetical protein|uniref:Uncharacterized protein n=1 Tax=Gordonia pseudamarae TaxID=2831662 RepID=A0ABX6IEY5_9ACTN|nr:MULTISPECIES: hypothetical protein [Gordonia]MBD0023675.1 hypothetical protein [Gordonia sp. (in: high G+C Gram-positive bacteria)]QHN25485.1 hypothetical protein GII33_05415 [Gordonia pseudamarae]QHN34417.1 hypothetical protein GII31_05410 [Gordonia pseudamarae]
MYRRWVTSCRFLWPPILTYTRRCADLLEWFETHLEPVASLDDGEKIGVAVLSPDLRIAVTRQGFTVDSGLGGLDLIELSTAIEGVLEVLSPKDVILDSYTSAGVSPLDGRDYDAERASYAARSALGGAAAITSIGLEPADGSNLIDLTSADLRVQVEWGVVCDDELLTRIRHPEQSRVNGHALDTDTLHLVPPRWTAPPVGLYSNIWIRHMATAHVGSAGDVTASIAALQNTTTQIAEALLSDYVSGRDEGDR